MMFTGLLGVRRSVGLGHRINVHELLLEDGQQEGDAVIQTDVQDELRKRRTNDECFLGIKLFLETNYLTSIYIL